MEYDDRRAAPRLKVARLVATCFDVPELSTHTAHEYPRFRVGTPPRSGGRPEGCAVVPLWAARSRNPSARRDGGAALQQVQVPVSEIAIDPEGIGITVHNSREDIHKVPASRGTHHDAVTAVAAVHVETRHPGLTD